MSLTTPDPRHYLSTKLRLQREAKARKAALVVEEPLVVEEILEEEPLVVAERDYEDVDVNETWTEEEAKDE